MSIAALRILCIIFFATTQIVTFSEPVQAGSKGIIAGGLIGKGAQLCSRNERCRAGVGQGGRRIGNAIIQGAVERELPQRLLSRVLQKGGHTIGQGVADVLNDLTGRNLGKRDWGRAIENLKGSNGLRPSDHGSILDDGSYVGSDGENYGAIDDYLP